MAEKQYFKEFEQAESDRKAIQSNQAENAMLESEINYKEFIEGTSDLVTRVDKNGIFLYINHMSKEIFGLKPKDIVGMPAFDFIHPDDKEKTQFWFNDCVGKKILKASFENKQINKINDNIFNLLWTTNFHYDKADQLTGINGIAHNITERKQMEEALVSEKSKLQDAILEIKELNGMLPICSSCKKIRDDKGYWNQIESYIRDHSAVEFSHSICPHCTKKLYPDFNIPD
jgi:PAS domain S-box-containing protein